MAWAGAAYVIFYKNDEKKDQKSLHFQIDSASDIKVVGKNKIHVEEERFFEDTYKFDPNALDNPRDLVLDFSFLEIPKGYSELMMGAKKPEDK